MKPFVILLAFVLCCSSPAEEQSAPCHLKVSWDQISPVGSGPFNIEYHSTASLAFSVSNAIEACGEAPLNIYWFVDFDPASDSIPDASGPDFVLPGCHEKLAGAYPKTVVVEALATQGKLILSPDHPDSPVAANGDPVQHLVWAVVVSEASTPDCD